VTFLLIAIYIAGAAVTQHAVWQALKRDRANGWRMAHARGVDPAQMEAMPGTLRFLGFVFALAWPLFVVFLLVSDYARGTLIALALALVAVVALGSF
jgi:hypothetical protein